MLQLGGTFFGTCASASNASVKVVSDCPGFVLYTGASIYIKFTQENSADISTMTLNVNSTGGKQIRRYGTIPLTADDCIKAGMICNFVYDGTYWIWVGEMNVDTDTVPTAYCTTASQNAAKVATCTNFILQDNSYIHVVFTGNNTSAGALTLNINNNGAKPIYINGSTSGQSNYTLPAGAYLAYYDGTAFQIRTDGVLPGVIAGNVASITNNGSTITYTMGDGTTASFVVPNTQYTAGASISITNNSIINTGVRAVGQGTEDGTISVNTGGVTRNVAVKGLGSAAFTDSGAYAPSSHAHGNVSNTGLVTNTGVAIGDGDSLLVADASNNEKLIKTDITFDGTTTNQFLTKAGTWEGAEVYSHPAYTARSEGLYKITVDNKGHVSNVSNVVKADITALGIPDQDTTYVFDGTYNATSNKAATVSSITTRIENLDGNITGTPGTGKTLTAFSETDGIVSATFGDISITKSQISDFAHEHNYAGSATPGGPAYTANYAISAGYAITANFALEAEEASHAASAVYAASAKTASNAVTASNANNAAYAGTATYALNAQTASNAVNAGNAITAGTATTAGNAIYAASAGYADNAGYSSLSGTANFAITANFARTAATANAAKTAAYAITAGNAIKAEQDAAGNVITTTYATKTELNQLLASQDAMVFKGTIGTGGTITVVPSSGYSAGDTYRVITAGTYAGQKCEIGDLLIAVVDGPESGSTITDSHWTVAQTNIDGAVTTSQTSATSGSFAMFTGTTGKTIVKMSPVGSASLPIYIDNNGVPQTITSYQGKSNLAGTADYASLAGTSTYALSATCAAHATTAGNATYAGTANHAKSALTASYAVQAASAGYATSAAQATSASNALWAGTASFAGTAAWALQANCANHATSSGFANLAGTASWAVQANCANNAVTAGYGQYAGTASWAFNATTAGNSDYAGTSNYALEATHATTAVYSATSGYAANANFANLTGTASWAITANRSIYANSAAYAVTSGWALTAAYAITAGNAIAAASAGYATSASEATHASSAAFSLISSEHQTAKMFVLAATAQAASGIISYSHTAVYATDGDFAAKSYKVAEHVTMQYNTATNALDFIFNE